MLIEEFQKEYDNLNDEQKNAVDNIDWPVMVVAWPWTWKTQIIWLRTANIILKAQIDPENILITTFTDAWVIAIRKRLIKFLWNDAYKVWVSTIHSFCQEVIKTFPEKFLEYKASYPIDEVDFTENLRNILDKLIEDKKIEELTSDYDKYFYLMDIKSRIWNLKQEWVTLFELSNAIKEQEKVYEEELSNIKPKKSWELPKKYETSKASFEKHIKKLNELLIIYDEYNKYLRSNSKYDFSDMINFVLEVFKKDEDLRYYYSEKYQYIMLDEYQDTNNPQNTIIDLILQTSVKNSQNPNIMVVWDDDQSIYRFQWANIENMLDFSLKYQDTKFIVLKNNYRSNQAILDLCTNLIENNNERLSKRIPNIKKELISQTGKKSLNKPFLYNSITKEEEYSFILWKIKEKIISWIPKSEIAIITRNNREVEEFSNILEQNWIEVSSKQNTNILKNSYVLFLIKFLKVIKDPYDFESDFIDILRSKIVWINQIDVFKITRNLYISNYNKKIKTRFFDYFLDVDSLEIELKNLEKLVEFRNTFIEIKDIFSNSNLLEGLDFLIKKLDFTNFIDLNWTFDDIEDIYTFLNKIKDFTLSYNDFNLDRLLTKVDLFQKYNYSIPRQILKKTRDWVNVLTAHSSKWLEYEIVFIPNLITWNWDNKKIIDKLKLPAWIVWKWLQKEVDSIEEERRLFFVACSRAKEELYLSFSSSNNSKILLKSVFLEEIIWSFEEIKEKYDENIFDLLVKNSINNNLIEYNEDEFSYIEEFLQNYKLSATDLNLFLEDPLLFLNNVIFKYPFIDNEATIFWKVYHRVLELFYSKYKENWKLEDKSYLTSTFKYLLEKEFLTDNQREKLLEKWIKWLEWFYKTNKNNFKQIAYVEYDFRTKAIFFEWIPLTWKIDKIELSNNWELKIDNEWWLSWSQLAFFKESVSLVDYKTWKAKSIWEIKWIDKNWNKKPWEWKYFRQLLFYKLMFELDFSLSSKYQISSLALDFVEWREWIYKFIEVDYENEDLENLKLEILDSWKKINDLDFWREKLKK